MTAAAVLDAPALELSPFQSRVCTIPERFNVALSGGRGGAKSFCMAMLALRHIEEHKERARVLFIRQTYKGVSDFEGICHEVFGKAYGSSARYNASEHVWRFANGAYMELGQLQDNNDYLKYQGRSFTLLLADECGHYATPTLLDRLQSNMRARRGVPLRVVYAANPGDQGHQWFASRYVFRAAPWQPFVEPSSGTEWVNAPSTLADNPFIDQTAYRRQITAACAGDAELAKAWIEGDWSIRRGAFFAGVLSEDRNAVDPWSPESSKKLQRRGWEFDFAYDHGTSAPAVALMTAVSPGGKGADGKFYPPNSIVIVDETHTAFRDDFTRGDGSTIPIIAEDVRSLAKRWSTNAEGPADDSIFAESGHAGGSIAKEFAANGVRWRRAGKGDRVSGWSVMRTMLAAAGQVDVAGLYICRDVEGWWSTVPLLGHNQRRLDDVDTTGADHWADATRYRLGWVRPRVSTIRLIEG